MEGKSCVMPDDDGPMPPRPLSPAPDTAKSPSREREEGGRASLSPRREMSGSPRRSISPVRERSVRRNRSRSHSRSRSPVPSPRRRRRSPSASRSRSPRGRGRSYSRSKSRSPLCRGGRGGGRQYPAAQSDVPPCRVLGVFGLSMYTTQRAITDLMSKYGRVEKVDLILDRLTGRSKGFGFVYFDSTDSATEAREATNGLRLDERTIRVDYSKTKRAHTPTPGVYMGPRVAAPRYDNRRSFSPAGRYSRSRSRSPRRYDYSRRSRSRSRSMRRNY